MKKILIISPHFPPSNLTAVHRARLFANHLAEFGWEPILLTVHEKYYEEAPDYDLVKLLPDGLRIEKVNALPITRPRLIGDIGLRGFFQLFVRARKVIREERIDFLYIPIPSFYVALLGRWLHKTTGIKYGIDYIDPWVHQFPGSHAYFSRARMSTLIARIMEPIAVKKAALITGVAESYYRGMQDRNPQLAQTCIFGAMPYGGEKADHDKVGKIGRKPYLFQRTSGKLVLVYAGTLLPKAYQPLEAIFQSITANPGLFRDLEIHFIGSGKTFDDPEGYNVKIIAEKYQLWNSIIFEYPKRIPYLDVLVHLDAADGILILGSTEPHYTPSKVYQGVLAGKPIFAVLHKASSAVDILKGSGAGIVLTFNGEDMTGIRDNWEQAFGLFNDFRGNYHPSGIKSEIFDQFSAASVTKELVRLLNRAI